MVCLDSMYEHNLASLILLFAFCSVVATYIDDQHMFYITAFTHWAQADLYDLLQSSTAPLGGQTKTNIFRADYDG